MDGTNTALSVSKKKPGKNRADQSREIGEATDDRYSSFSYVELTMPLHYCQDIVSIEK